MQDYLDRIVNAIGCGKYQWFLLLLCGMSFISDAMEIVLITFVVKEIQAEFSCSNFMVSFMASTIFFGMFWGSVLMGPLSDTVGRKWSFFLCMILVSLGGLSSGISASLWLFILLRTIVGVGIGGLHISVTLFSEFIPLKQRPLLITLLQGFWSLGVVLEVGLAWALRDASWRTLVLFTAIPAVISTCSVFLLPESPLYLFANKRVSEAMQVFRRVARINAKLDDLASVETPEVVSTPENAPNFRQRMHIIFSIKVYRATLFCFIALWFVGSFNYCGSLFLSADLDYGKWNRYFTMFLISLGEIAGKLLSYAFLSRWSRRWNIILCVLLSFLGLVVIAAKALMPTWLVVVGMLLYRISISMFLTVLSLYTPESFPTEVRSSGFGIATSGSRIGGMLTPFIAIMVKSLNHALSISIFGVSLLLATLAVYFLPFDTYKMSLNRKAGEETKMLETA